MAKQRRQTQHVTSRYQETTDEDIEELRGAAARSGGLREIATWLSLEDRQTIVAESLDADRVAGLPVQDLVTSPLEDIGTTDYACAVAAERLMTGPVGTGDAAPQGRARSLLVRAGESPTASLLLAYESLYRDLAEDCLSKGDRRALDWLARALAHNLKFHGGDDLVFGAVDLASAHLQLGDLDDGLRLLARVIRHDPSNPWTYRFMATGFGVLGLVDLGLDGARRGLQLFEARGDPENLRDEFLMAEFDLLAGQSRGRESEVSSDVLAAIAAVLDGDFTRPDHDQRDVALDDLVPEVVAAPIKRPIRFEDLPQPVRDRFARLAS